ncbi:hypothetical protein [Sinimarinibacterium flocculans]|uniref:hypothetical protein n=1 Tax=Sinimarinibacterium flocculans TaxID=985250 RepID=UPI0011B85CC9|nr:hypothetical protein [Sinimarinibacterium flocculans]
MLLEALSVYAQTDSLRPNGQNDLSLNNKLGTLLRGTAQPGSNAMPRLSDNGLVKLFRLLRLTRRLLDLEAGLDNLPGR